MHQHKALQTIFKQAAYATNSRSRFGPSQTMSVHCSRSPFNMVVFTHLQRSRATHKAPLKSKTIYGGELQCTMFARIYLLLLSCCLLFLLGFLLLCLLFRPASQQFDEAAAGMHSAPGLDGQNLCSAVQHHLPRHHCICCGTCMTTHVQQARQQARK